jgi:hypothetical protein
VIPAALTVTLLALCIVASACSDADVELTFVNRTDASLCLYHSLDAPGVDACSTIDPMSETKWTSECGDESYELRVVLTVGETEPVIYNEATTCGGWLETGAIFVVEKRDADFVVKDSLP